MQAFKSSLKNISPHLVFKRSILPSQMAFVNYCFSDYRPKTRFQSNRTQQNINIKQSKEDYETRRELIEIYNRRKQSGDYNLDQSLLDKLKKLLGETKSIYIANEILAIVGQAKEQDIDVNKDILAKLENQINQFETLSPKNQIMIFNNLQKLNFRNDKELVNAKNTLSAMIANVIRNNIEKLHRIDLILFFSTIVKTNVYDLDLIQKMVQSIFNQLETLNHQDLSNFVYHCGRIIETSDKTGRLEEANYVREKVNENQSLLSTKLAELLFASTNHQQITHTIWAVDRLRLKSDIVLNNCERAFFRVKSSLSNQNFAIIVNSFTHMDHCPANVFDEIKKEILKRKDNLTIDEFSSILRAVILSKEANYMDILDKFDKKFVSSIETVSIPVLTTFLLAYTTANMNNKTVDLIYDRIQKSLSEIDPNSLGFIVWSLAVLERYDRLELWQQALQQLSNIELNKMSGVLLRELCQGYLSLILYFRKDPGQEAKVKELTTKYEQMRSILKETILIQRYLNYNPAEAIKEFDFHQITNSLGIKTIPEFVLEAYNIDYALINVNKEVIKDLKEKVSKNMIKFDKPGQKNEKIEPFEEIKKDKENNIYVEIDGEYHYIPNTDILKGGSILKSNQLRALGYKLVIIKFHECYELSKLESIEKRALALLDLIEKNLDK
jgi:RAP domain.